MGERLPATLGALLASALFAAPAAAAPGMLDPGFGSGGVTTTATAPGAGGDFQNGLTIQRDHRILAGGESDMGPAAGGLEWRISRYTPKGRLDLSFGLGGTVTTRMSAAGGLDEFIWDLALQPDGKIVAAGEAVTEAGGFDVALARYDAGGALDASFGNDGKVITPIGPGTRSDRAHQVRVLAGGKILVAGFADMGPGAGRRNFMLARYNADGTRDATFGGAGVVVTPVAPGDGTDLVTTNGLTIDPAGRIVVSGEANFGPGAGGFNAALARYTPDGALDPSFDGDGIVTTPLASGDNFDSANGTTIDQNGTILIGGNLETSDFIFDWALARYNPDGSLDASFGTDGTVTTNVGPGETDELLQDVVIQQSGEILVGGAVAPRVVLFDSDFAVARYTVDGRLDGSFGGGGIVTTDTAAGDGADEIYDIALMSDSKLVVSGECDQATTGRDVCVARIKSGEGE